MNMHESGPSAQFSIFIKNLAEPVFNHCSRSHLRQTPNHKPTQSTRCLRQRAGSYIVCSKTGHFVTCRTDRWNFWLLALTLGSVIAECAFGPLVIVYHSPYSNIRASEHLSTMVRPTEPRNHFNASSSIWVHMHRRCIRTADHHRHIVCILHCYD